MRKESEIQRGDIYQSRRARSMAERTSISQSEDRRGPTSKWGHMYVTKRTHILLYITVYSYIGKILPGTV